MVESAKIDTLTTLLRYISTSTAHSYILDHPLPHHHHQCLYHRLDPSLSSTRIDTAHKSSFLEEGEAAQEYFFLVDDVGVQRPVICHHHHLTSGVPSSYR